MKKFRTYQPNQLLLLPPALNDWIPDGHLALFISDVVDSLDLSEIYAAYDETKGGQPPYHPALMVKLLVYGYSTGVVSSRQIERATWEDIPFRVLAADQHPDHDSLATFRKKHLTALSRLFTQVLQFAMNAGLVGLYHVAVDGSKIPANASLSKSLSLQNVKKREQKLRASVEEILKQADKTDQEEDEKLGDRSTYLVPEELRNRESRLKKIQELKERMEEEQRAIEEAEEEEKRKKKPQVGGRKRKPEPDQHKSDSKSLCRNSTDYDSRIMLSKGHWGQCFNAQAVVDEQNQIIIAGDVTNEVSDVRQLVPMLELAEKNAGRAPQSASADAGYFSNANVQSPKLKHIDIVVPPNRGTDRLTKSGRYMFTPSDHMRQKLSKPEYQELYKKRKTIVEPVFGQIKEATQAFRRFTVRGLGAVRGEWNIVCMAHNLLKLHRSGWRPA
jgi:transposase